MSDESKEALIVVAVKGDAGDWAAYAATVERAEELLARYKHGTYRGKCESLADAVAMYGHKITSIAAERLFPSWAVRLKWRP